MLPEGGKKKMSRVGGGTKRRRRTALTLSSRSSKTGKARSKTKASDLYEVERILDFRVDEDTVRVRN